MLIARSCTKPNRRKKRLAKAGVFKSLKALSLKSERALSHHDPGGKREGSGALNRYIMVKSASKGYRLDG